MKKIIVFLLMIVICFGSLSLAAEKENLQKKSNFNWGGLMFAIIFCGLFIAVFAAIIKNGENYIQDAEQFNRDKKAVRMNAHFKEEERRLKWEKVGL